MATLLFTHTVSCIERATPLHSLCMETEREIKIIGQKNAPPPLEDPAHGSTCVGEEGRVLHCGRVQGEVEVV